MSATGRGAKRLERDAYPTPTWCTEAIIRQISWGKDPQVFEPCAGTGAISEVLRSAVCYGDGAGDLVENDIADEDGMDFLDYPDGIDFDFILTNPPFSLAQEFIDKSLQIANCVIMLLPQSFFGSKKRKEWWQKHPPTAQFILSERPSFTGDGKTDSEVYSWVVWDSTGRQKVGWHWL